LAGNLGKTLLGFIWSFSHMSADGDVDWESLGADLVPF